LGLDHAILLWWLCSIFKIGHCGTFSIALFLLRIHWLFGSFCFYTETVRILFISVNNVIGIWWRLHWICRFLEVLWSFHNINYAFLWMWEVFTFSYVFFSCCLQCFIDLIVNGIIFLISFSSYPFLVYRKATKKLLIFACWLYILPLIWKCSSNWRVLWWKLWVF
jgi:hypothetical protein